MKPIYFPGTYVPRWVAQALAACFKHFIVYWPSGSKVPPEMQNWVEEGVMEIRLPAQIEEPAVKGVIENFRSFASLYRNGKEVRSVAFLKQQADAPFFCETAVSRIVGDVKRKIGSKTNDKNAEALLCAQVFLHLAQEFDRQRDELNQSLDIYDQRSQELIKNLRGRDEIDAFPAEPGTRIRIIDPVEYMALDRLQAWARLFMEDPIDEGFFVTSSQSAFNHLVESHPAAEKIIQSTQLPAMPLEDDDSIAWRNRFLKHIRQLTENADLQFEQDLTDIPRVAARGNHIAITLYRISGRRLKDLLASVLGIQAIHKSNSHPSVKAKNTLLGFIERRSFEP